MTALQISPRIRLQPGDRVKITGGETWRGQRIGVRGLFEFRGCREDRRGRTFADVVRIDDGRRSQHYTLFAGGKPFRRAALPHMIFRPYRFRRVRGGRSA